MQIIKAYAGDTGAAGKDNFSLLSAKKSAAEKTKGKTQVKASGDSLSLSAEAREMLENNNSMLSTAPQDATYDQFGNMTRQFDSLQNDLRKLAAQLTSHPHAGEIKSRLGALGSQLMSIQAQV